MYPKITTHLTLENGKEFNCTDSYETVKKNFADKSDTIEVEIAITLDALNEEYTTAHKTFPKSSIYAIGEMTDILSEEIIKQYAEQAQVLRNQMEAAKVAKEGEEAAANE